jgi:hypothetical protein
MAEVGARGSDRWRVSLADDLRRSLLFLLLDKTAYDCHLVTGWAGFCFYNELKPLGIREIERSLSNFFWRNTGTAINANPTTGHPLHCLRWCSCRQPLHHQWIGT